MDIPESRGDLFYRSLPARGFMPQAILRISLAEVSDHARTEALRGGSFLEEGPKLHRQGIGWSFARLNLPRRSSLFPSPALAPERPAAGSKGAAARPMRPAASRGAPFGMGAARAAPVGRRRFA
ncbi:hypothetical protein MishRS11D_21730 [Methylomagnum ishizawai]|nr:hypothetical protein MishRS11D_21730 [Methylomagnum ishizawai]